MNFHDQELSADIETRVVDGSCEIYINGKRCKESIPLTVLDGYPSWVAEDVIRLVARKFTRKELVDRLSAELMKGSGE